MHLWKSLFFSFSFFPLKIDRWFLFLSGICKDCQRVKQLGVDVYLYNYEDFNLFCWFYTVCFVEIRLLIMFLCDSCRFTSTASVAPLSTFSTLRATLRTKFAYLQIIPSFLPCLSLVQDIHADDDDILFTHNRRKPSRSIRWATFESDKNWERVISVGIEFGG